MVEAFKDLSYLGLTLLVALLICLEGRPACPGGLPSAVRALEVYDGQLMRVTSCLQHPIVSPAEIAPIAAWLHGSR